jgi:DNA-dependent RNA polymerase auxiliary subunit epsilon
LLFEIWEAKVISKREETESLPLGSNLKEKVHKLFNLKKKSIQFIIKLKKKCGHSCDNEQICEAKDSDTVQESPPENDGKILDD